MERVPLPPAEAGPGAGGAERGPDAAGAAGPHTGHGPGGDALFTALRTPGSWGQSTGQGHKVGGALTTQGRGDFLQVGNRPVYGGGRSTGHICQRSEPWAQRVTITIRCTSVRQMEQ